MTLNNNDLTNFLDLFINTLFPNFETCYSYYHDYSLDNLDTFTKMLIGEEKRDKEKIRCFNIWKKTDENLGSYIKTEFLKEKPITSKFLLLETFSKRILNSVYDNENDIKNNNNLFKEILNKEKLDFLAFIKTLPTQNNYYAEPTYFNFDKSLEKEQLIDGVEIYQINDCTHSAILKITTNNLDIEEYFEKISILKNIFALMFDKDIKFELVCDEYSKFLENYGCKSDLIHSFNLSHINDLTYKNSFLKLSTIDINNDNFGIIRNFINLYLQLLNNLSKDDYKSIALDFYMDSIDKSNAARVTYLMIALEALFNINKLEIKRTVTQRCCKILQHFFDKEKLKQIEKDLNEAYNIRSEYAHGKYKTNSKASFDFVQRLSQYTRLSIVILLQLANNNFNSKKSERRFINEDLIDKSLLYDDTNTLLLEYFKDIKVYKTEIAVILKFV